jgi:cobalt/nickel transport protein
MVFRVRVMLMVAALAALPPGLRAEAHFLEIIPSADILGDEQRRVVIDLAFTHPMNRGPRLDTPAPCRFGVLTADGVQDLTGTLETTSEDGKAGYRASYAVTKPGDHVFFVEPAPLWEPSERALLIHYGKVVVDYGAGKEWESLVGLPMEIRPLVRPYGLWTGNLFRGLVLKNGQPLAFADVEVAWRNDGSLTVPSDPFEAQVVKTDAAGVFAYAMPRAGWWGFNALSLAAEPATAPDGRPATVELGGTIWVKVVDMK